MEIKVTKTYLWIIATAISKIKRKVKPKDCILKIIIFLLIRAIKICPAVMLAANRTDRVMGRIIWLVLSIKTINWERAMGVPDGTKWENALLVFLIKTNKTYLNQKGIPTERLKLIWAVAVKI